MSGPAAIAAVTATLRSMLDNDSAFDAAVITTRPPDKARPDNDTESRVNVFCYRTSTNGAWRNMDMPSAAKPGERGQPPLPLVLHYVITAYGAGNDETLSNRLLGSAVQVLHENPVLARAAIGVAMPANGDLDRQHERVRLTYDPLSLDDMSKLWSTFQTEYRLSAFYQASVVLIESGTPVVAALPVLRRGSDDQGVNAHATPIPPFPTITSITPPAGQPTPVPGDIVRLEGHHLGGDSVAVAFRHALLANPIMQNAEPGGTDSEFQVTVPNQPANMPAGIYTLAATITTGGEKRTTSAVPFVVAPKIVSAVPANQPAGEITLTVTPEPQVRLKQRASLLFGNKEATPAERTAQAEPLVFDLSNVPAGEYFLRLRVDGVDSLLIDYTAEPPAFKDSEKVTVT